MPISIIISIVPINNLALILAVQSSMVAVCDTQIMSNVCAVLHYFFVFQSVLVEFVNVLSHHQKRNIT